MKPNQKQEKINWNEQFKIRPRRNVSIKHEIIKLILVLNLIEKHKSNLSWIRIYTEYPISNSNGENRITDVYFEDVKKKEIICYEIQNNISDKWLSETTEFYKKVDKMFFTTDWVLVKEKEHLNDIEELNDRIKELVK
jgi:hypothetical protein